MPIPNRTIHLEKFTPICKTVILEAQNLADEMRHSQVTLLHLRASVETYVATEELLVKHNLVTKPAFRPETVAEFKEVCEKDDRMGASTSTLLSRLPRDAKGPKSAFLAEEIVTFIDFLGDSATPQKANLYLLVTNLVDTMKEG
jgi:hypothetical protein